RALLSKPEAAKRRSWGETAQDNREPGKLALPGPQLGRLRGGYRLPLLLLRLLRRLGGLAKLNPCEFSRNVFSRRATPPGFARHRLQRRGAGRFVLAGADDQVGGAQQRRHGGVLYRAGEDHPVGDAEPGRKLGQLHVVVVLL